MATQTTQQTVTFRPESLATGWDEAMQLAAANWAESGHPEWEFQPNRAVYERLEEIGAFKAFSARDEEGRMVGYAAFILGPHLHTRLMQASQDVVYLTPAARQGWTALQFIRWVDEQLAACGVEVIFQEAAPRSAMAVVLRRRRYRLSSERYAKRVGHG
jgi:hypothetical protein